MIDSRAIMWSSTLVYGLGSTTSTSLNGLKIISIEVNQKLIKSP